MAEALTRPVCTAKIAEDDSVEVTVDAVPYGFSSMSEAVSHIVSVASDLGRPVKLTAIDPTSDTEPQTHLIVAGDGSVTTDTSVTVKKRASRRGASRSVTLEDIAPSEAGELGGGGPADDLSESASPDSVPVAAPVSQERGTTTEAEPALSSMGAGERTGEHDGRGAKRDPDPAPPARGPRSPHARNTPAAPIVLEPGDPRLDLRPEESTEKPKALARKGWRGWCNQTFHMSLGASAVEQAARTRRVRIQRPLQTHRTAAVVQLKGGQGKTTTAYHLAATYGRVRGGNILAGEFNENQGTMGERAQADGHDRTTLDLIRNIETVTRRTPDLVRYIRPQGDDRIHVLASPPEGTDRSRVDGRSVRAAHETLRSLYSLMLLDTGNSAQASTWQAAVDVADSLVFAAANKEDGMKLLKATAQAVTAAGHAEKLGRSILVVSNTTNGNKARLTRFQDYAQEIGLAAVVVIPFDPSLDEGESFDYDALRPATVRAYEEATAALTDQL